MKFPHIALIGGMGVGKSTILGELARHHGYRRMSWAEPVKDLARLAYGEVEKNRDYEVSLPSGLIVYRSGREILQRIGTDAIRDQVDNDFWVKAGLRRMTLAEDKIRWVNDDSRFPNEVEALKERGFAIVRLTAPDSVRTVRLGLTPERMAELSQHPSETLIAELDADIEVENVDDPASVRLAIVLELTRLMAAA